MARDLLANAASLMERAVLSGQTSGERWLLALDPVDPVARALDAVGAQTTRWNRWALAGRRATAEPPEGPFDALALRLPAGREALELAIEMCAARLATGAELWLYGANAEGIKSAPRSLEPFFDEVETVDTRKHCRLWRGVRGEGPARGRLAEHATRRPLPLPEGKVEFTTFPGVFAHGELDMGTRWLLSVLPALAKDRLPRRVLDYACGLGILGAAARQLAPEASLDAIDADAVALAAARENLTGARVALGDGWAALTELGEPMRYDWVLSNPPLHRRTVLSLDLLEQLISKVKPHLTRRGKLVLVTQRQRAVQHLLDEHLSRPRILAEDARFRVWSAGA